MKFTKILAAVMSVVMLLACTVFSASAATTISLADITPGFINLTMDKSGADDLGVTLSGPWQTAEGWGYTYWNFLWEQIEATPYMVIDIPESTMALFGGWCDLSIGWVGTSVFNFRTAGAGKQVVDLRDYIAEGANDLCFCVTTESTDAMVFDALYLTSDPNNQDTGVESAVAVAAATVIGAGALIVLSRKK